MQNYSFKISLRIWHPNIDPDEISNNLEIQPNRSWQVGSQRITPKGTILEGNYKESYWNANPFNQEEYCSSNSAAEDVIKKVIKKLESKKEYLLKLKVESAKIIIQISSFGEGNYAIVLPPEILHEISELYAGFAHDVYSCEQK